MKTMQWDGSLHSANELISWVNKNRPDEDEPAHLSWTGYPHIRVNMNNRISFLEAGNYILLEDYSYSIHPQNPLISTS